MSAVPAPVRVFLCGEGPNELGTLYRERVYQSDEQPGVLHALLTRAQPSGWVVGGACSWKNIRKFRTGRADHEDTRNVRAVALDAREAECEVLAFTRDCDSDPEREEAVARGIESVTGVDVIGGVAIPSLEGWLLALLGVHGTEAMKTSRAAKELVERGLREKHTPSMVTLVEGARLDKLPADAVSLRRWHERAKDVLSPLVAR